MNFDFIVAYVSKLWWQIYFKYKQQIYLINSFKKIIFDLFFFIYLIQKKNYKIQLFLLIHKQQ